jgi:hypothetical protein
MRKEYASISSVSFNIVSVMLNRIGKPRRELFLWCREHGVCPWTARLCGLRSCSWLDVVSGNVVLCPHHGNPNGFFVRKRSRVMI